MSDASWPRWIAKAHGLLLNAACKRAWGESVAVFDPGSLVNELRPAITDAIGAASEREAVASTLLDLYRKHTGGYGALSRMSPSALRKPENYRKLLRWLYRQRWYKDGPPTDEGLVRIWRFRAALVDAFVCEPT